MPTPTWYLKYSNLLSNLLWEFAYPLKRLQEFGKKDQMDAAKLSTFKDYTKSKEMKDLYGCMLLTVRFVEGISWGYSPLFIHDTLEKPIVQAIKVVINLLLCLK